MMMMMMMMMMSIIAMAHATSSDKPQSSLYCVTSTDVSDRTRRAPVVDASLLLTFHLLTSNPNQIIFVLKCTKTVNCVKFAQAICEVSCLQTFGTHTRTHGQPQNIIPPAQF